jgi:hypothetical protein
MSVKLLLLSILIKLIEFSNKVNANNSICYKQSYGRGVGVPLSTCSDKYYVERDGALCYPKCKTGYTGCGPVCWEDCRPGYDNHGATCCIFINFFNNIWIFIEFVFESFKVINADIYGKGCCCTSFNPSCCGICRSGYVDDGCTCRKNVALYFKDSYGRTAGIPMNCKDEEEEEDAGSFLNLIL